MRNTDPDPQPFRPLGETVNKHAPAVPRPTQAPGAAPGILRDPSTGRLSTNIPLPKGRP